MMGRITIILLALLARIKSENQTCRLIGQTGHLAFSKEGDIIIGGVFSITRKRKLIDNNYQAQPHSYCTR